MFWIRQTSRVKKDNYVFMFESESACKGSTRVTLIYKLYACKIRMDSLVLDKILYRKRSHKDHSVKCM
jgi:hypothetical protein